MPGDGRRKLWRRCSMELMPGRTLFSVREGSRFGGTFLHVCQKNVDSPKNYLVGGNLT